MKANKPYFMDIEVCATPFAMYPHGLMVMIMHFQMH